MNPKDFFFRSGIHGLRSGSIVPFFGGYINLPKQRYSRTDIRTIRNCFVEDSEIKVSEITMISISMQQKCIAKFNEVLLHPTKRIP